MLRCRPDLPGFLCLIVGFATLGLRPGVASESRLSPETLNSQGIRALNAEKLAEALRDFKAAQQGNPANSEIAFNVGLTYFRMGQYEGAIPPLRRAVSVANPPAKALYLLGVSLYETSDFSASAAELEQLRRVNFQHQDEILYLLEESYRRGKDPAEAKECFQELADKFPDSAFLHKLMGSAYSEQGNERQALVEFKEAVAKNPSLNGVHRAIGIIYLNRHDDAEGSKWLIQEIVLNPCDPASHYYLANRNDLAELRDEATGLHADEKAFLFEKLLYRFRALLCVTKVHGGESSSGTVVHQLSFTSRSSSLIAMRSSAR